MFVPLARNITKWSDFPSADYLTLRHICTILYNNYSNRSKHAVVFFFFYGMATIIKLPNATKYKVIKARFDSRPATTRFKIVVSLGMEGDRATEVVCSLNCSTLPYGWRREIKPFQCCQMQKRTLWPLHHWHSLAFTVVNIHCLLPSQRRRGRIVFDLFTLRRIQTFQKYIMK